MTFTLLSFVILGATAALIYFQAASGYKKGFSKSLIHLAVTLSCAVFASLASVGLAAACGNLIMALLSRLAFYNTLVAKAGILVSILGVVVRMLLSLLLYLPVFFLMRLLVKLAVNAIIRLVRGKSKRRAVVYAPEDEAYHVKNDKRLGAAVGVLTGFVLAVVIFMPLTGLLRSADDIADIAKGMNIPAVEKSGELALLEVYANDASGTVLNACGGQALYDLTTRVSLYGHSTYLNKEIRVIGSIDVMGLKDGFAKARTITEENIDEAEALIDKLDESLTLKLLSVEAVRGASAKWLENQAYMGIKRPKLGQHQALDGFMNSLLHACTSTSFDTVEADIRTLVNLLQIFGEHGGLATNADYNTFMREFIESNGLTKIEDELYKNPHMESVHVALDRMIVNVILQGLDGCTDEIKERLYKGLAASLRDAQGLSGSVRLVAVSNGVSEHFANTGMYLPDALNDRMADILIQNVDTSDGVVTEDDVSAFFSDFKEE